MKKALVLGAGGFIGSHMVKRLKSEGYWVRGVDLKNPEFSAPAADDFIIGDLRNSVLVHQVLTLDAPDLAFDEIYQFAADMGGAGFVFTGDHDADIMHNSATINLNVLDSQREINARNEINKTKIFYSGSACMYPEHNQMDPDNPNCEESSAYPANPDSEYGWEKLFSERLFLSFNRNYKIPVAIARYHNIYGPEGTWDGGREKAPAAIARKIAMLPNEGGEIEVWGDGLQTRSFLYIDDCIESVLRFMRQDSFLGPVNIGSEEMVSINQLTQMAIDLTGKNIFIKNIYGDEFNKKYGFKCPTGVRGRNSDNKLYFEKMGWLPSQSLKDGIKKTFNWITQVV